MSYQLAILRHAKSDWAAGVSDRDRPLNHRGEQDAPRIGRWLQSIDWKPECILASPAERARQTIQAVTQEAALDKDLIDWREDLYLAPLESLLRMVRKLPADSNTTMLVGHNPGLEELVAYLSASPPEMTDNGKLFTTANLAIIEFERPWKQIKAHSGILLHLIRPKELRGR